ncbi:hypothetical protein QQ045_002872 [Rhodiola kirilowii]
MLRALVRRSASDLWRLTTPATTTNTSWSRSYGKSTSMKTALNKEKRHTKAQAKADLKTPLSASAAAAEEDEIEENPRAFNLEWDENNKALDYGPNGRPLFTSCSTLAELTRRDVNKYYKCSQEKLEVVLPEGLPEGMVKEFEDSMRTALLVRQSFLDLRDHFRRIVDPAISQFYGKSQKVQKQIVLDGQRSCGKSIALAMLVQWAREEGWLVLYVPEGKLWSHGGFFYKNPNTGLWDTPVQATRILQAILPYFYRFMLDFLKYNETHLQKLPCQIYDPVPLGEGAGVGWMKGVDSMVVPEGSTLYDLIQIGLSYSHAAVGALVRLRKELSLVKDIPVLIAVDQYNHWFTFSEYGEVVTDRSWRSIHAKELATVNAFRSMMHNDMMVGAFSHSTAVGKLRQDLPDVPKDARINLSRYSLDEAAAVSHYYLRQRMVRREAFSEDGWKKVFYLANGNGSEMRWLFPLMQL